MTFKGSRLKRVLLLLLPLITACGGGGGGGGGSSLGFSGEAIELQSITFPKSIESLTGPEKPPMMAPLSQQVVFTFSGKVESLSNDSIFIYAEPDGNYAGPQVALDPVKGILRARGHFAVMENKVVFNPYLPEQTLDLSDSAKLEAVPGLLPGFDYHIFVPIGTASAISNLTHIAPEVVMPLTFSTGEVANLYFDNFPLRPPKLLSTVPEDGFSDLPVKKLDGTALPVPFKGIELEFDLPLDPSKNNLSGSDLTGDGHDDPLFFFRFPGPDLLAASIGPVTSRLVKIDRNDGTIIEVGPFTGNEPVVTSLACSWNGEITGLMAPDILVTVDPDSGGILHEVELQMQDPGYLTGLCHAPSNQVYCLAGEDPVRLICADPSTGDVFAEQALDVPVKTVLKDLFFRWDGTLLGFLRDESASAPMTRIVRIDRESGALSKIMGPIAGDYTSGVFIDDQTLLTFEQEYRALVRIDLETEVVTTVALLDLPQGDESLEMAAVIYDLGTQVELTSNTVKGGSIRVNPLGLLPFGTPVEFMIRHGLKSIRGFSLAAEQDGFPAACSVGACFTTHDPGPGVIEDRFLDDFDDLTYAGHDPTTGYPPASWNVQDGDQIPPELKHLVAARGGSGTGELGDLVLHPYFSMVILNTDYQQLPLATGGTPHILKPVTVKGGVFNFRNIVIPPGVTLLGRGSNPLVLNAIGTIDIEGTVDVSGDPGVEEISFDSAFIPTPGGIGGPSGGRGGASQPACPPDFTSLLQLKSSPAGETGYGPKNLLHIGGRGGQSGSKGYDIKWNGFDADSRGSGGGGGLLSGVYVNKYTASNSRGHDGVGFWGVNPDTLEYMYLGHDAYGGEPGNLVFKDDDLENDFLGPDGEFLQYIGAQGGGGGGVRLDSMHPDAQAATPANMPTCMWDGKGGGGGGGGGCVVLRSLGAITIHESGSVLARGGKGGGGEKVGEGGEGGGGGGGGGGVIIIESGERIVLKGDGQTGAQLDVSGGQGADAKETGTMPGPYPQDWCVGWKKAWQWCSFSWGDGGQGGYGIIQLMVPDPDQNLEIQDGVTYTAIGMTPSTTQFSKRGHPKMDFWWDPDCLVDPHKTVSSVSAVSCAVSKFIDLGMTPHRAPIGGVTPPLFEIFEGTGGDGFVLTNNGWVQNAYKPGFNDIEVDAPDLGLSDYIPEDINSVKVEFQGADAVAPGSGIPDPATVTEWDPDPQIANGMRFIRFRILFDVAKNGNLMATNPRPQVNYLRIRLKY